MYFNRLKEERKQKKIKQNVLAELLGIASRNLLRYENGERTPDPQFFEKLSQLGFDVQYILTGTRSNEILSPEEHILLQFYRDATPAIRKATLAVVMSGNAERNQSVMVNGNIVGSIVAHTFNEKKE